MTTRIVTYAHRYKRPPRKRKASALEVPTVVTSRRSGKSLSATETTSEEHQRRGDAADALWRELVRRVTQAR
jgi:hypothetical protein